MSILCALEFLASLKILLAASCTTCTLRCSLRFLPRQKSNCCEYIKRVLFSLFFLCYALVASAADPINNVNNEHDSNLKNIAQQILLLTDQEKIIATKIEQLETEHATFKASPPQQYAEAKQYKEQIQLRTDMVAMLVDELTQSDNDIQQRITELTESQKKLQVEWLSSQNPDEKNRITTHLDHTKTLIDLNQKQRDLIIKNLALANQLHAIFQRYVADTSELIISMNKHNTIQEIHEKITAEQLAIDTWLERINVLHQHNQQENNLSQQIVYESDLFYYTQRVHLSNLNILVLKVDIQKERMNELLKKGDMDTLKPIIDDAHNTLLEGLKNLEQYQQFMQKQSLLLQKAVTHHWLNASVDNRLAANLNKIKNMATSLQKTLTAQQADIDDYQKKWDVQTTQQVAKRQVILKTDEKIATDFLYQLISMPKQALLYLAGLWGQTWHAISIMSIMQHLLITIVFISSSLIWWFGRRYFSILARKRLLKQSSDNRIRTAAHIGYIVSAVIRRNLGGLCLFFAGWFILWMADMNFNAYLGLFYTAIIWFFFRAIMGGARIVLVERGRDTDGHDVTLYHRLKWVFMLGGWVTVVLVLSKQFALSSPVFEFSNRLFMAFLLTVSVILIRARNTIPRLLEPILLNRKYVNRTVHTVCWLLPTGLFISAGLGVLGYANLSWILLYYQAALVLIVAAYIILRGVMTDIFEISADWMILHLNQGWLYTEAFLKPADKLCRLFLFLAAIVCAFLVLDWRYDSMVVMKLRETITYPFFSFMSMQISLFTITETIALIALLFWLAKWSREFAYRWIFRNAKDTGIQNSLAVFCQYTVIFLGLIIILRVLGLDITGLSMILGGLAVGLGFGLRDFASNIIGGLMLLIERTVKEGDTVSIGNYEGEVTHIGIRAMRIRSWDHIDVMVPNSEILTKSFLNLTHQDSTVRTVIPIKIHRTDDPITIQANIEVILKAIPEVLLDPPAQVLVVNAENALIEFEIRYFINIALYRRSDIRSKILIILLETFKEMGVRPPYTQQDSYVWEIHKNES